MRIAIPFLALFGCSKPATPSDFAQWLAPVGEMRPAGYTEANEGKRFHVDGYLQLSDRTRIDDGKATLDFYDKLGGGRPINVEVKTPGDVDDLMAQAEDRKAAGYRREVGKLGADALKIRARKGTAGPRDKIRLTFEVEAMRTFNSKTIQTCVLRFEEAEKL